MYFSKARGNHYSRLLEHAVNHFQRALNVTEQLYILVLYCATRFFVNFKMAAVFLVKPQRRDHSPKRDESIDITLDPPQISLDSPFKVNNQELGSLHQTNLKQKLSRQCTRTFKNKYYQCMTLKHNMNTTYKES